ncbi:hypothetical protein H6G33_10215 [Calothrix sp. FACHB-1219]|uniref:hypothetical protein n=1 Tax=unclassified Calothrix TaxID=2619626 RepID=UPI00168A2237|nr:MULTISPECIES: hypothetical protein [unclassified Calothrix]MBD2201721.1 hypothetical protein [Calothrix sp. FACHB-168]MBD2217407.1 hypothetical protein [Calothrix sp. FACHB-1219]
MKRLYRFQAYHNRLSKELLDLTGGYDGDNPWSLPIELTDEELVNVLLNYGGNFATNRIEGEPITFYWTQYSQFSQR